MKMPAKSAEWVYYGRRRCQQLHSTGLVDFEDIFSIINVTFIDCRYGHSGRNGRVGGQRFGSRQSVCWIRATALRTWIDRPVRRWTYCREIYLETCDCCFQMLILLALSKTPIEQILNLHPSQCRLLGMMKISNLPLLTNRQLWMIV